jgi:hypothetical protein
VNSNNEEDEDLDYHQLELSYRHTHRASRNARVKQFIGDLISLGLKITVILVLWLKFVEPHLKLQWITYTVLFLFSAAQIYFFFQKYWLFTNQYHHDYESHERYW